MKINELKINSYGNLNDKNLNFGDGINIVYGENEKGKSTVLNFIVNSFYGSSKNKKGRDISDFDKFKPWSGDDFSGKLTYTLDNTERFEVFRDFSKKNPKIYNENMDEVSKNYSVDKNTGNQFFFEQTKVDETTFCSSVVSFQNEVEISSSMQNVLLQKMANVTSTGDDNISYKKAIEKLNKKQLDEIGTSRSQGKPINIVVNEIEEISKRNDYLKKYENYKYEIEEKRENLNSEIEYLNVKNELLKRKNEVIDSDKIQKEKIKFSEEKIDELESKIESLIEQKENYNRQKHKVEKVEKKKINSIPYILGVLASVIAGITSIILVKNVIFGIIFFVVAAVIGALYICISNKAKKYQLKSEQSNSKLINENDELARKAYEIEAQIALLEKSRAEQIDEVEKIKNEVLKSADNSIEQLKYEFSKKLELTEINKILDTRSSYNEVEKNQDQINEKKLELHRLELDKQNILPQIEEMAENEEKLAARMEQYEELKEKNNAINTAKEILEAAYLKMKNNVTPKFTNILSQNIEKMTNNKYSKIVINEADGILVQLANGEYKEASRLSLGTLQQIYLAFRLSVIENLSEEKMPIILDEAFAFYDDTRLKETLKNMYDNYADDHQIIIFTCTKREEAALQDLGYNYELECL